MGNNEWIQVTGNVPVSGGSAEGQTGSENVELNAEEADSADAVTNPAYTVSA
jgi:hypothetical protein